MNAPSCERLSRDDWALLLRLADPEREPGDLSSVTNQTLFRVLAAARERGVAEILLRKLDSWLKDHGSLSAEHQALIESLRQDKMQLVAKTMLLDHHAKAISSLFRQQEVRAEIVKGPSFSDALYANRGDRIYSDIDFLVALEDQPKANMILQDYGALMSEEKKNEALHTLEYPWVLPTSTIKILIELQGDLIHSPRLRRHVRYGYREHTVADEMGAPETLKLLIAAVIHTSCGNKFNVLKVFVDVLQACRKIQESDHSKLVELAKKLRLEFEIGTTLNLVARLFKDEQTHKLSELFSRRSDVRIGGWLISSETIYQAREWRFPVVSGIKRQLFRSLQKSAWVRL